MSDVPCFVGIDVAKAQLDIALRPSGERWAVANDASGVATLVDRVQALQPTLIVLEPPGAWSVPPRPPWLRQACLSWLSTRGKPGIARAPPGNWPRPMRWMPARWRILPT